MILVGAKKLGWMMPTTRDTISISTTMALSPIHFFTALAFNFLVASTIRQPPYLLIRRCRLGRGLKLGGQGHDILLGGVLAVDKAG